MKLSSSVRLTSAGGFRHGTFRDTNLLAQKVWELLPDLKWLVVRDSATRIWSFELKLDGDEPVGTLNPDISPSVKWQATQWMEGILESIRTYGTRREAGRTARR